MTPPLLSSRRSAVPSLDAAKGDPVGRFRLAVGTLAGAGLSPWVPGTTGTLAAIPVYLLVAWPGSAVIYSLGSLALIALSIWACAGCERHYARKDPGPAVADELAGYLVTMAFIPLSAATVAAGFFLFRILDVLKPPPARRLESLPGGWGIVADDVVSGLYANVALRLLMALWGWAAGGAAA